MSFTNFNTSQNNTSRGKGATGFFHVERTPIREGLRENAACNDNVRYNTKSGSQFNKNIPNKPLVQRKVTNEDVNPKDLTVLFKGHKAFEDLTNLYNGQKNKTYFNYIHASVCFSQAVSLFTKAESYNDITKEQLTVFRDKVLSYSESFDDRSFANVANDAGKLLHYAQNKKCKDSEKAEELAYDTLCDIFKAVNNKENLQNFKLQHLSNVANNSVKLLGYAQNKKFEGAEEAQMLACNTLCSVFIAVNSKNNIQDIDPQALTNLAHDAVKLLNYTQKKNSQVSEKAKTVACNMLHRVFQAINAKENLQEFIPQALANLACNATKYLLFALKSNLKEDQELARSALACIFQAVNNKPNLQSFSPQHLANLAHSLVQAGYWNNSTSELLIKIGKTVCERNFNTFELQGICNLAWSFSVGKKLTLIDDWLIKGLTQLNTQQTNELTIEGTKQLYMAFLRKALDDKLWNKECPDAFLNKYLNKNLTQKISRSVNEEDIKKDLKTSKLQKDVGTSLEIILPKDYSLKEEYYIKPYPIDFAIFRGSKLIALVEVNGPTHFMCNGTYNLAHEFKETLVKDMSYAGIINIDYTEWNKSNDQQSFLNKKLEHTLIK